MNFDLSHEQNILYNTAKEFGEEFELGFANAGDQNNDSIPEKQVCKKMNVTLIDGLGDKIQSSSWLLKKL